METIIVKPKDEKESKEILSLLRKMKVKAEVYKDRTKKEILDSIERGMQEVADYKAGKIKLRDVKSLLDEL